MRERIGMYVPWLWQGEPQLPKIFPFYFYVYFKIIFIYLYTIYIKFKIIFIFLFTTYFGDYFNYFSLFHIR